MLIKIPKKFFDDHLQRALPAPPVVAETARSYTIDTGHKDFPELVNDAQYYAAPNGPDASPYVKQGAKALLQTMKDQGATLAPYPRTTQPAPPTPKAAKAPAAGGLNSNLHIRLTGDERAELDKKATARGFRTVSAYIRFLWANDKG